MGGKCGMNIHLTIKNKKVKGSDALNYALAKQKRKTSETTERRK